MVASNAVHISDQKQVQRQPETPKESFRRMADNDAKQNSRLSARFSSSPSGSANGQAKDISGEARPVASRPSRIRFVICTLGLMSLAMSSMSRMVLNLSIPQMVDPSMLAQRSADPAVNAADGSCPWPDEETVDMKPTSTSPPPPPVSGLEDSSGDQSLRDLPDLEDLPSEQNQQVVEETTSIIVSNDSTSIGELTTGMTSQPDRFMWTMKQQNVLLGGFYYSYFVFMVLGGRMSEAYGAKYVLLLGVAGSALINLLTPYLARTTFVGLVLSRVLMGAIQSGVFPGMYALIGKWLTMSEASIYAPLIKMNLRLGMVLGSLVPGLVAGWPNVFYFTGVLSAVWSILWLLVATSRPEDNRWVNELELYRIQRKKRKAPKVEATTDIELSPDTKSMKTPTKSTTATPKTPKTPKTPWLKLLTAPSVIGLILVKLTFNYALDFLAIELPSYLKYVHHVSKEKISAITTPMFAIQVLLIVFVGWLAKICVQRRPFGWTKTTIRKLFQSVASFGIALGMFLVTFNDCNLIYVAVLLQFVSFLSMFTAGGETMLPYDLSEEYPATIMAIANSVANVSAITTTTLAGLILGNDGGASYAKWNILMYLIVGANVVGGLAFLLLVKAEPIDFEEEAEKKMSTAKEREKSTDLEAAAAVAPPVDSPAN